RSGDRAGPLHGRTRANGGRQSGAVDRRCTGRAKRGRRTKLFLQARWWDEDRHEGRRRASDALLRSARSRHARRDVQPRRLAALASRVDREGCFENTLVRSLLGAAPEHAAERREWRWTRRWRWWRRRRWPQDAR